MDDDTKTARVAYLRYLTDEFYRYWPSGSRHSSEPGERDRYDTMKKEIADMKARVEADLA